MQEIARAAIPLSAISEDAEDEEVDHDSSSAEDDDATKRNSETLVRESSKNEVSKKVDDPAKRRESERADRKHMEHNFKKFAANFKLHTPIPKDLVPILALDPEKQNAILKKSEEDAREWRLEQSSIGTPARSPKFKTPVVPVPFVPPLAVSPPPGLEEPSSAAPKRKNRKKRMREKKQRERRCTSERKEKLEADLTLGQKAA